MKKVIVVGSGAGGATVARELSRMGIEVTLIEKGHLIQPKKAYQHYETQQLGVELLKTVCVGGTTLVTAGNGVRTCQKSLKKLGVDLENEFEEVEKDLGVKTLPNSHFGPGTRRIMDAARSLGFSVGKMPKFIDPGLCKPCGKCAFGCSKGAKWTSLQYLEESMDYGAKLVEGTAITEILTDKGKVTGVKSAENEFKADIVIISAGAVETPRILMRKGINAGENLFVDTFVTVGGLLKGIEFDKEVQTNALIKLDDFIMAPHFSSILVDKLQRFGASKDDILGMMIKIKDEASGKVTLDAVTKYSTSQDVGLLAEGSAMAGAILKEAGVDSRTMVSTPARGAHPGGTAAIGDVVDENLETEIEGLFVADASVLPQAPGAPPLMTIVALAKRLAKYLINHRMNG